MSWITSWWKDEKETNNYIIGAGLDDIIESRGRYDGDTYVTFKPQIDINFLDKYRYGDSIAINVGYASSVDNVYLNVKKLTINTTENQVNIDYLKNIEWIRLTYDNGNSSVSIKKSTKATWNIENLQVVNTNNNIITPLSGIEDVPEITIETAGDKNNYNNAILTNFKNYDTKCTTNLVIKGDLSTFYEKAINANLTKIMPQTVNEGEKNWTIQSVNDIVKTEFYDENGEEVIFYSENQSYLDLSNYRELELGTDFWSKFYVKRVFVGNDDELENPPFKYWNRNKLLDSIIIYPTDLVTNINITDNTVIFKLEGTESDFLDNNLPSTFSNGILNINLNDNSNSNLVTIFSENLKDNIELYVEIMNIDNGDIEFSSVPITQVNVKYGDNTKTYNSNNIKTHLSTLNIISTVSEDDPSIQPVTYSTNENGTIKVNGLLNKTNEINLIDIVNSINTIVTGNTITENRIILVNEGLIPKMIYTDILPINETNKHYVNSDGTITNEGIAQLIAINEPPEGEYLSYKSSMNLIDVQGVDIIKFGESVTEDDKIVGQNVFLSSILVYDNEINLGRLSRANLMSRNVTSHGRTLGEGESPDYAPTNVVYQRDDIVYTIVNEELRIKEQNCNNFLKSVTEIENGVETVYTDIYLNQECSSGFKENESNELHIGKLFLINQYEVTFNGSNNMGKLRIHYIKSNPENEGTIDEFGYVVYIPSSPKYEVVNLFVVSGEYKNDTSNLIPHPINWTDENDQEHHVFNKTNEGIKIDLKYEKELTYIVNVIDVYCINTLVKNKNKNYYYYLIVYGEFSQWIFKDLLPLPRNINENNIITNNSTEKTIQDINRITNINDYIGISLTDNNGNSTESEIDLTNVADLEIFNRIYNGVLKRFFVNKVKVLKRFEGKIDTEGNDALFQYYNGMTLNASTVTFEDDWALKLPDCYESCEVSKSDESIEDGKEDVLTVKFGEYLQIDYEQDSEQNNYLFKNLCKNDEYYLDLSMKIDLDLSNITTLNVYLDTLKYITSNSRVRLLNDYYVNVIVNINGFLESKKISENKQEIDICYLIHETIGNIGTLNKNNILIKPANDIFSSEGNIKLYDYLYIYSGLVKINKLKCTNIYQKLNPNSNEKFSSNTEVNLLVSGNIPKWLGEYFYSEDKALPIKVKSGVESGNEGLCELVESDGNTEISKKYFMITSINALPAPGIGIDNSAESDQCKLNLKDFIPQN